MASFTARMVFCLQM
ncbi:hypothetical protein A6R68_19642 [Neotoma lepida]|uniref:Uncharacterized protein n=1 Tax=Neotoma lepida TaxID=56216 RepID=A0A1A6HJ24_NEOLE|nr:hypothetical protein A6R68_19642 [Neotoma lepida]